MAQQHKVTVHGAPGPEPFTVISVKEHTTAKQLINMVSHTYTQMDEWMPPMNLFIFSSPVSIHKWVTDGWICGWMFE